MILWGKMDFASWKCNFRENIFLTIVLYEDISECHLEHLFVITYSGKWIVGKIALPTYIYIYLCIYTHTCVGGSIIHIYMQKVGENRR